MKRMIPILAFFTMLGASAAELTGTVSFERGLYTYSYELSASEYPVTGVLVLVDSNSANGNLRPVASSPQGWDFDIAFGANPNYPDFSDATFLQWSKWYTVEREVNAVSGFSFTTNAPPAVSPLPITYLLYAGGYEVGPPGLEEYYFGSVVAPDFLSPVSLVPEPQMYMMFLGGIALLGCAAKRRKQAP